VALADKAYIAATHCVSQIKKQRGHPIEDEVQLYNNVRCVWGVGGSVWVGVGVWVRVT
jgi:hypothetical protein